MLTLRHRSSQYVDCWGGSHALRCPFPSCPTNSREVFLSTEAAAILIVAEKLGLLFQQLFLRNPFALLLAELNLGTHFTTLA